MDEKNSILKRGPKQSLFDSTKYEFREVDLSSVKSQVWKYFSRNKKEGLAKCKTCDVVLKAVQSTTATTSVREGKVERINRRPFFPLSAVVCPA